MLVAFEGISRPISVIGADDVVACFPSVLRGWRFAEVASRPAAPPVITVRKTKKGYRLDSPWRRSPAHYSDRVDTVCSFIVDLTKAYLANHRSLLCLHCAAAEFAGKLVVFPNPYRSGKSTLSAYLASSGIRVYADDVLLIASRNNRGVAAGIAPRLRLPLAHNASAEFRHYVQLRRGLANRRYLYLNLESDELAPLGATAPIGGIVLLRRDANARTELVPASESAVLKRTILQNFARSGEAADILRRLHALVGASQCFSLRYANGEQAVALLKEAFAHWPVKRPDEKRGHRQERAAGPSHPGEGRRTSRLRRNPATVETAVDGELFLVNPDSQAIFHLDTIGAALWRLLADPIVAHPVPWTQVCLTRRA